ncbi:hypothetical protein [Spirosoma litoris]
MNIRSVMGLIFLYQVVIGQGWSNLFNEQQIYQNVSGAKHESINAG